MPRKKNIPHKKNSLSNTNSSKKTETSVDNESTKKNSFKEENINNINSDNNSKYIFNKNITNDILIDELDEDNEVPISIIYDNHKFILFTKNPLQHKKNTYKCCMWRRIKNKTTNNFSFCQSTITCKIINNKRNYYIGQQHSIDCNNVNIINYQNKYYDTTKLSSNYIKEEYINRLNEYIKSSKESHITKKKFKAYALNI